MKSVKRWKTTVGRKSESRTVSVVNAEDFDRITTDLERRVVELEAAMGQVQSLCMSFPEKSIGMKAHSVRQMLDIATKALNPTAEAVSHE